MTYISPIVDTNVLFDVLIPKKCVNYNLVEELDSGCLIIYVIYEISL